MKYKLDIIQYQIFTNQRNMASSVPGLHPPEHAWQDVFQVSTSQRKLARTKSASLASGKWQVPGALYVQKGNTVQKLPLRTRHGFLLILDDVSQGGPFWVDHRIAFHVLCPEV